MPCNLNQRRLAEFVKAGHPRGRRDADGVQHDRRVRRRLDGHRGHEGLARSAARSSPTRSSSSSAGTCSTASCASSAATRRSRPAAMALARLDIPGLVLYNGTIYPGTYKGEPSDIVSVYEAIGAYRAGKITLEELYEVEERACPGAGACGGQFTANTMATVCEFLGLSPAGLNGIPAEDPKKDEAARRAGELVMTLVHHDIRPSHIVTRSSLENAIASVSATGGSTNAVLHLPAIAAEFGIDADARRVHGVADRTPLDRRHAAGRPVRRGRHVRRRRRRPGHARAAQARPAPRRREDGRRPDDREDRRRHRRDARARRSCGTIDNADQGDRRDHDPARQPRARRLRRSRSPARSAAPTAARPGCSTRELACFEAVSRAPDRPGRRRRDPLRGTGRRARACRRCSR